ncbi:GNAT family N-acetyltransferase [Chondromyces apiculatus]|uniref:Ribosomal-protein-L7p-serine acetyltransferase n=1 Tax=Chondromyces apiculatus DSM 436 TaxID=1192034 RepID=A0A017T9D0_9BACT|nr:GNAT family protein [Chondromyces apiculatus]EYF05849.1 Ribosomal-protein-L7p-serine acetyltransferase [Chondromyces apiculatus DSM 436]
MLILPSRQTMRARPIETERLLLLPIDASDGPEIWNAVSGSRVTLQRWLPWVQFHTDPAASTRFAEACAADWDQGRALRFVIRERSHRAFAGVVGLESCVHMHRSCELGYWLRKEATGRGLMTEASRAVLDFAFQQMGAHRVRVAAATDNPASLAVIGRLGFRFEGIARQAEWCDGRWLDHGVFALIGTDPR